MPATYHENGSHVDRLTCPHCGSQHNGVIDSRVVSRGRRRRRRYECKECDERFTTSEVIDYRMTAKIEESLRADQV
jgi:transcriptional regulator NrdR family protein